MITVYEIFEVRSNDILNYLEYPAYKETKRIDHRWSDWKSAMDNALIESDGRKVVIKIRPMCEYRHLILRCEE